MGTQMIMDGRRYSPIRDIAYLWRHMLRVPIARMLGDEEIGLHPSASGVVEAGKRLARQQKTPDLCHREVMEMVANFFKLATARQAPESLDECLTKSGLYSDKCSDTQAVFFMHLGCVFLEASYMAIQEVMDDTLPMTGEDHLSKRIEQWNRVLWVKNQPWWRRLWIKYRSRR
jgi:hypothetical protein